MTSPEQSAPPLSLLKGRMRSFWHRVSDGLELNQLWSQFEKDARSSYRLYSADVEEKEAGQFRYRRFLHVGEALFWAFLGKLTPARRGLSLLGLVLIFPPSATSSFTRL